MGILKSSSSISSVWEYWNIIISIFSIEILNRHHLHLQYHYLHLILYVEIPDFYVLRGTQGSLSSQQWLSHRIIVVSIFRSKRPILASEAIWLHNIVEQSAMYFASTVRRETLDCFLLNHELIADLKAYTWFYFPVWDTSSPIYICVAIQSILMATIIV